jgi:hypothetical protein
VLMFWPMVPRPAIPPATAAAVAPTVWWRRGGRPADQRRDLRSRRTG